MRSLAAGAFLLASCAEDTGPLPITERRTASRPSRSVFLGATPADRFGATGPTTRPSERPDGPPPLLAEVPDGWEELEASRMRLMHYRPARDPRAVCYLTALPGDGGGLVANVNRWRSQMGYGPLDEEEVLALPKHTLLGGQATLVQLEGELTDMSGETVPDSMMVGLILPHAEYSFFLKMTGPSSVIGGEIEGFLRLAETITVGEPGTDSPGTHGHPFSHATPDGWVETPPGRMRIMSFDIGDSGTECYVSFLGGGGGLEANVNRWRAQLGLEPLSDEAVAALPSVSLLGATAPLVELEGDFTDMDGQLHEDHALLGTLLSREGGMLFVKMVGPAAVIARERESFKTFVESLEVAR